MNKYIKTKKNKIKNYILTSKGFINNKQIKN